MSILYHLFEGAKRLSELKRLQPTISQKVLIEQLREMERHGIVHREVFRQVPVRVDYTVTELGLKLKPVILSLCEWGKRHTHESSASAAHVSGLRSAATPLLPSGDGRGGLLGSSGQQFERLDTSY
jgi:DNA-binding HxlR family transcriptional regulator